jgi:hypothetical protein
MISEVINALFVTYLATECGGHGNNSKYDVDLFPLRKRKRVGVVFVTVLAVNAIESATGIGAWIRVALEVLFHVPKVFLVIFFYIITLYLDCLYNLRQHQQQRQVLSFWSDYLPRVVRLFLRICPIYPIMAVGISFVFLFLISLFELLRIPTHVLNAPIYYGTLYGPFSYIYYHVKRDVIMGCNTSVTLPHHRQIPIMKLESAVC